MSYDSRCANCGKGEESSISLKSCTACKMVKYCNRECQIAHRPQHKKECRKRAAELHDEKLFRQPPPAKDCPICFMTIPSLNTGRRYMSCCGKNVCSGCMYAPLYDDQGNEVHKKCPFCRTPLPKSAEEAVTREKKRVEAKDAQAIHNQGMCYSEGLKGFPQDNTKALELWYRAAELGHTRSYCSIGNAYDSGEGVEVDKKKARHYYELGAIGGHARARHNLGYTEGNAGNFDWALRHLMIATRDGLAESLNSIKGLYSEGYATKDDYMKALQLYQTYLSEVKSDQRDEAAAADEDNRYY